VSGDGSPLEEIRYFLPNALAIAWTHMREVIDEAVAAFE
jgi:hypothetical protein